MRFETLRTAALLAAACAAATLAPTPAAAQRPAADDVEGWVAIFENPERFEWQQLDAVSDLLAVAPGENVADIGAGTGLMIRFFPSQVGEHGRVYAVDVNPAFLEHIRTRRDIDFPERVTTILAEPDDPKLPPGEIDAALILNTWHHIDDRVAYARRLAESMSESGRVLVVDWRREPLPVGPPVEEKVARTTVIEEFERAGWRLTTESGLLIYHYMLMFAPPEP